jgi:hypothetical protein
LLQSEVRQAPHVNARVPRENTTREESHRHSDRVQLLVTLFVHGLFLTLVWRVAGTNPFLIVLGFYIVVILTGLLIDATWHDEAPEWVFASLRCALWVPLTLSFLAGLAIALIGLARRMMYSLSV